MAGRQGPDRTSGSSYASGTSPAPQPAQRTPQASRREGGGVPDGMLLALIGFLLGMTVLVWTGTGLAGLLSHGHWPRSLHFTRTPLALRGLVTKPTDLAAAWQHVPGSDLPRPGLFWGVFIGEVMILLVLAIFVMGTLARFRAVRAARRQQKTAGFTPPPVVTPVTAAVAPAPAPIPAPVPASVPQVPTAVTATGSEALGDAVPADPTSPGLPVPSGPVGLPTGQLVGSYVLFTGHGGNAREDKASQVVQPAVLDAQGPVIVTCVDARTWQATISERDKLGPVHVFDPEHLVDTPGRLRWAPHNGCQDPVTAASRARALLAPLRTHDVTANDAAVTLMRCWLHAAAVDGLPFRQLHRWASGSGSGDAVRILRTARDAASGWSGELESTLHAHPERRDTALSVIRSALSGLNSLHIRDACSPGRSDALDLESFVNDRGTLYVVGASREDPRTDPGAMPLLTALVSNVVEHGRRMAAGSSPGRLDPPLTCVFDDIATTAPIPELPALMAEGPTLGIPVLTVLRSEDQARHRWPTREAPSLWQNAHTTITL